MQCPRCGKKVEKEWGFCPNCGFRIQDDDFFSFDDIFERMHKQMQEMFSQTEKDFEVFDLSPVFRKFPSDKKAKGFKVTIRSGTGMEPEINVRTFGDVKDDELRKEIFEHLGKPGQKSRHEAPRKAVHKPVQLFRRQAAQQKPPAEISREPSRKLKMPELTEEPKASIRRLESGVVVDIEMPGVGSKEDIEIKELENSVEVKAVAGNKAYFKILTKPSNFSLSEKKFEKGRLHLVFS